MAKKSKLYAQRATNAIITVVASVAANKGLDALKAQPFMQTDAGKLGVSGGATALGLAGAVMAPNEMLRSAATGVAAGAGNKLADAAMAKMGMAGMGNTSGGSAASDYLELYQESSDMGNVTDQVNELDLSGVDDVQIS